MNRYQKSSQDVHLPGCFEPFSQYFDEYNCIVSGKNDIFWHGMMVPDAAVALSQGNKQLPFAYCIVSYVKTIHLFNNSQMNITYSTRIETNILCRPCNYTYIAYLLTVKNNISSLISPHTKATSIRNLPKA